MLSSQFTVFLYIPRAEIAAQLASGNEISFKPTFQAWEGLGIFGIGYASCKPRLFVRPSSILVGGYRHTSGRDFAKAAIELGYSVDHCVSIRITNAERRRILQVIQHNPYECVTLG